MVIKISVVTTHHHCRYTCIA